MSSIDERVQIIDLGLSLFNRGLAYGSSGNISSRVGQGYAITPTNSSLGRLNVHTLAVLDHEWNHVRGDSPSKEVFMHRALYRARPQARAIVHLHSTYVTALSCLRTGERPLIPVTTPYLVMKLGPEIPIVPYYRPGSPDLEREIVEAGRKGMAIILSNHGSLVAGESLEDAVNCAEELEASARQAFLLLDLPTRSLNSDEVTELLNP